MVLKACIIPTEATPFQLNLAKKPGHTYAAMVQECLGHYGKIVSHDTDHGVLLEAFRPKAKDPEVNGFASKLAGCNVFGRCMLLGKGPNNFASLSKDTFASIFNLFKEITGIDVEHKEKRSTHKPAFSFFSAKAFREKADELANDPETKELKQNERFKLCVQYAREQWKNMTAEQKAPYEDLERENRKAREETKKANDENQPHPPHKPRGMYQFFFLDHPDEKNMWKTLDAEKKQKWADLAQADKERFDREWQLFVQVCHSKKLDPVVVASRHRKPAQKQVFIPRAKALELIQAAQASASAEAATHALSKPAKPAKVSKPIAEPKPKADSKAKAKPKAKPAPKAKAEAKPKAKRVVKPKAVAAAPDAIMQVPLIQAAA